MVTQAELRSIPLPDKTNSYCPVPNGLFIDTILEATDKKGFHLVRENWNVTRTQEIMHGSLSFEGSDPSMHMEVGILNSYNKSKPATIGIGNLVVLCQNGFLSAQFALKRKHTIGVMSDLNSMIDDSVNNLYDEYLKNLQFKDKYQNIELGIKEQSELLGRLFVQEELVAPGMVNVIKKEIVNSELFPEPNLWSFYNHITEGFKLSHPTEYIDRHINFHKFINTLYN